MSSPLSNLTGFFQLLVNWNFGQNMPASSINLPQFGNSSTQGKKVQFTTGGNTLVNGQSGVNEFFYFYVNIAAGGSATIDLTNLTDISGNINVALVRLKCVELELVAVNDDSTNGTPASSVTVGNAGANGHPLFLDNPAWTFTLVNGQPIGTGRPDAAGIPVSGASRLVKFQNNDNLNPATVRVMMFGATL